MSNAAKKSEYRTISGKLERYISGPTADGFAIISVVLPGGSKVAVKGTNVLVGFGKGDKLVIKGREVRHPRYGNQIQAFDARISEDMTNTSDGLAKWIAEAGIEGIGKARAQEISKVLGSNAIERIVNGDDAAKALLGKRYDAVRDVLVAKYGEAKFGPRLAELGLGRQMRLKIYEKFAAATGHVVEKQPYRLITEIEGISFDTADKIARKAGMPTDCEDRIMAAACHVLREAEDEGHTWLPLEDVIKGTVEVSGNARDRIEPLFRERVCPNAMQIEVPMLDGSVVTGWAPRKLGVREEEFAMRIEEKLSEPRRISIEEASRLVAKHERAVGIELNSEQREAAIMALVEPFCVITGGPGRGKTTVLKIITRCWKELGRKTGLASPTGKAAQRMRESTGIPAQTLHRMLGAMEGKFQHNEKNPLSYTAIAIDESSMLDVYLGTSFARAWGDAQILLIGDAEQIASVGPGKVLRDLVASDRIPTVRLVENRRQKKGSAIATGAEMICRGQMPKWEKDLQFLECRDNEQIANVVESLFERERADGHSVQILTPGHASEAGTIALNDRLRVKTNDDDAQAVRLAGGAPANIGDEVIQLENCDERGISNGDVGRIKAITGTGSSRKVIVEMQTPEGVRDLEYASGQLSELGLAWALTVHKAQGSEYDVVIIPMTTSHWRLLRRTLFFTAVTRGKGKCFIVGQKRAIRQALDFDDSNLRNSRLESLLGFEA